MYTQGNIECNPAEIGYNEQRLEVLNKHLEGLIHDGEIYCASYCMSRKGRVFAHGAVGSKSYKKEDDTPLTPDDVHYIASITKTFTTVAIMKLMEDGVTRLDVPVGDILPQFNTPPYNQINLFHLLTHTSGLYPDPGCFENKYQTSYWDLIETAYERRKSKDEEFDWISASLGTIGNGLRVKPGTEWAYCSFGFTILGAVIETLSGMFAHDFIEEHIIKPLQLNDTGFRITPDMAKRYIISNENIEKQVNDVMNGTKEADPLWDKIPDTGGGLHSTPYDLVRYGNMMLYGGTFDGVRILGRKAVEKMTTFAIHNTPDYCWGANEPNRGYGVGFDMRNSPAFTFSQGTYMHEGSGACALYVDPKEELVVSWFAPYVDSKGWYPRAMYSTQNIFWSGLV